MHTIDLFLELFSGNFDETTNQFYKLGEELLMVMILSIVTPILAVVALFVNLADVGMGIKNTLQAESTESLTI